jgi:hypothetical protein
MVRRRKKRMRRRGEGEEEGKEMEGWSGRRW